MLESTPERADLRCPRCRSTEGSASIRWGRCSRKDGDEVLDGVLVCESCAGEFPVEEGVAIILRQPDVITYPGPPDPDLGSYVWADFLATSNKTPAWCAATAPLIPDPPAVDLLLPRLGRSDRVLDMGCGVGGASFAVAEHADFVLGCDLRPGRVKLAIDLRRNGRATAAIRTEAPYTRELEVEVAAVDNADFIVADALDPPLAPYDWSAVILNNLWDVVPRVDWLLGQTDALTKPGGWLLVTSPYQFASDAFVTPADPPADLRARLEHAGYTLTHEEERTWILRDSSRRHFVYRLDVIVARHG